MRVFRNVLLKYGHENAEMQKRKFDDVTLRYSIIGAFTSKTLTGSHLTEHVLSN